MDAKPQRPLRNMRVRNDENMPPDTGLLKTIHQRNKSSPALTMMPGGGVFKTGARRTAFGDVTNIASLARPSKDDSILPMKAPSQAPLKSVPVLPEKKSTALLRPAQRPLSVSSLRNLLTGVTNNNAQEVPMKNQVTDNLAGPQPTNTRKVLTKRNTIIFKDAPLESVREHEAPLLPPALSSNSIDSSKAPSVSQLLPDSRLFLPPPPITSTTAEPIKEPVKIFSDTSLPGIDSVSLDPTTLSSESEPSNPSLPVSTTEHPSVVPDFESRLDELLPSISSVQKLDSHVAPADLIPLAVATLPPDESHETYEQARTEPEEYWEEENEDGYEEEGYVTARSFRSKEDNTTGGATTILFPQMNQRARKEISAAKQLVEATRSAEEIEDESYDTSMVAEYGDEIFEYMKNLEVKMLPNAHYMDNQHEIQWSMRSVLMDWLVQVHHRFNLLPETLFLCVNYIDRFLSCKVVSLGKLQLVGATAIFIAAKYEEINCPSVQEIVYMVDSGYSIDEILKAERFMLTMLQFELGWPGPMSFLRRISKADDYDLETRTLAKYFLEVTIMDERFIGSPPSFAAAASHCLARMMLRKGVWSPHHVFYSGYTFSQLRPLVNLLLECCDDPRKHHAAVYNKYCDKRYKRASAFVETEIQRGFRLPELAAMKSIAQQPLQTYYDSMSYFRN